MKVLVLNCGSSSLKYQLIDMENEEVMAQGNYEKIGSEDSFITHKVNGQKYKYDRFAEDHTEAIKFMMEQLTDSEHGVISSLDEINAIGHRIVHGGEKFTKSVIIDEGVIEGIKDAIKYAPLHNPAHLQGIMACKNIFENKPNVAVFDTAFHQTMPKENYIYPIPYKYYEKYGIRKYGAHGTSHKYVALRTAQIFGRDDLKIINCHIGQGASLCAIKNGKCVDTSMGLTPLGGIAMGSRSGDLDPSIVTYIMEAENLSPEEINKILNKESGILGVSKISADNRDVLAAAEEGNENAKLAMEIYTNIIAQFIAKYAVILGGVDVITFTAGVGERGIDERREICKKLEFLGVKLDLEVNNIKAEEREISCPNSTIKVWIVPTNEELMIAKETISLI